MSIEQKYKKLTPIEHILARPARYVGSINEVTTSDYAVNLTSSDFEVSMKEVTYSPAYLKLFDEIITNSIDHSMKPEGKHLNKVEVTYDMDGTISVYDNGGIPVVIHSEHNMYVPELIFGELHAGSNFNDDEQSFATGQNGEGSSLTAVFSTYFKVETADGKNKFSCVWQNNLRDKGTPEVSKSKLAFTRVTYTPDFEALKLNSVDYSELIARRVVECAACNPHIKFTFNGVEIKTSFEKFVKKFYEDSIFFENEHWQIALCPSENGMQHTSFVNSTRTYVGGTHIDYVSNMVVDSIRDYVKKKTKQDLKPSDLKNHFHFFINAKIVNPRYNSQTKERLETLVRDYGTSISIDDKIAKKIQKSTIVEKILEWADRKRQMEELKEAKKLNKEADKANLKKIVKYETATEKIDRAKCTLIICEGDSAAKVLQSSRDPRWFGVFPLKGKPINVAGVPLKKILENEEFTNLMMILGLKIGEKADVSKLRYGKLLISSDADMDGIAIRGLVINNFYRLWPELFEQDFIQVLKTPVACAKIGKQEVELFSMNEMLEWEKQNTGKKYTMAYFKGLGTFDTAKFKEFLKDSKYIENVSLKSDEDKSLLIKAFDKSEAEWRKGWILS